MDPLSLATSPHGRVSTRRSSVLLLVLLVGVLIVAGACERSSADLGAREITYLLAAESLARDFDFRFGEADHRRLRAFPIDVDRLLLGPPREGRDPRYAIPIAYPLVVAPFVRLAGLRGPPLANALLLSLAVLLAIQRLSDRVGSAAAALVAVLVFCSVTYRSVFLIDPVVLLLTVVVAGLGLTYSLEEPGTHRLRQVYRPHQGRGGLAIRWLLIGGLLGVAAIHHPLYLLLVLPVVAAAPTDRRRIGLTSVILGILMAAGLFGLAGGLLEDLAGWAQQTRAGPPRFSVGLTVWNLLYFLVGRNTGLLPYFLPLLALLGLWQGGSRRALLVVAAAVGALLAILQSPFDFYGGPAAVGNRWLVPWYGALWFVPSRPLPRGWLTVTAALSIPLMIPTWVAPRLDIVTPDGIYQHASGPLHQRLPVETTQRELPPAGQAMGDRLWIRSLSREVTLAGAGRWRLRGDRTAELQLAAPAEIGSVYLQFGRQAEPELEVRGGQLGDMVLLPEGGVGFNVESLRRKALHPMWWSDVRHHIYVLRVRMPMEEPRPQTFSITAFARDVGSVGP